MTDLSQVQVLAHVRTARSVLAMVCLDLGGMWELAMVRMKPAGFDDLSRGAHLDDIAVRYIQRTAVDDQEVGLEVVEEWRDHPVWQSALRSAERQALVAHVPNAPPPAAARVRL